MPIEEIKNTPNQTYRKLSNSGQRVPPQLAPHCSISYQQNGNVKICKGIIVNNRCSRCNAWYGPGRDPLER